MLNEKLKIISLALLLQYMKLLRSYFVTKKATVTSSNNIGVGGLG